MGAAGRVACIFTPMLLTIASLVCLILIELSGWSTNNSLTGLYFFQANLTDITVSSGSEASELDSALAAAKASGILADIYQIHLWNYCIAPGSNGTITHCSPRQSEFYFDPVDVWQLNGTSTTTQATVQGATTAIENNVFGSEGQDAINAYRTASKWMFIAYEVSFWTTIATLAFGLLAMCSRFGSFLTWVCSLISSIITLGAVVTSTVLFSILVGALNNVLHPYSINLTLGTSALATTWLAVLFSWASTLFWLFSICCCSGRSNPHHRDNNRGNAGLWTANRSSRRHRYTPSSASDLDPEAAASRPLWRSEKLAPTTPIPPLAMAGGAGYQRVASPWSSGHSRGLSADVDDGDHLPLQDYAAPPAAPGYAPRRMDVGGAYEPYRHA